MNYLVDTDWVADYLKGKETAIRLLTGLQNDGLAISLVTYGEIYEGIYFSRDPIVAEQIFVRFLQLADILPLTQPIMKRFAHLRGDLRKRGQRLDDPDLLIAATAIEHGLILVTRN